MKTHRIIHKEIAQKESNETKISSKGLFQSLMQYMPTWYFIRINNIDIFLILGKNLSMILFIRSETLTLLCLRFVMAY